MRTQCVHCGQEIEFEADDRGAESTCPACGNAVMLIEGLHPINPAPPPAAQPAPITGPWIGPFDRTQPIMSLDGFVGVILVTLGALVGIGTALLASLGVTVSVSWVGALVAIGNILLGGVMYLGAEIRQARDALLDELRSRRP